MNHKFKKKIAFLWYWGRANKIYLLWRDGLRAAIEHIGRSHDVDIYLGEHIPEEEIDTVYSEMKRVGRHVIATIAFKDELTEEQEKYHVTNKSPRWWRNKLQGAEITKYHGYKK